MGLADVCYMITDTGHVIVCRCKGMPVALAKSITIDPNHRNGTAVTSS